MNRQQLHGNPPSIALAEQIAQNALYALLGATGRDIDHEAVIERLACQVAAADAVGAKDIGETLNGLSSMLSDLMDATDQLAHLYSEGRQDLHDISLSLCPRGEGPGDTIDKGIPLPASVGGLPAALSEHVVRRHERLSTHARHLPTLLNCPQVKARAEMEHVAHAMVEEALAKPPLVRLGNKGYETEIGERANEYQI